MTTFLSVSAPPHSRLLSLQTKTAFVFTTASLLLLLVLAVLFPNPSEPKLPRYLQENEDYASYSCDRLFDITPDAGSNQCAFSRTCNQGNGVWAPFVFCSYKYASSGLLATLVSPILILWLVLLFRLLGSTAEDYFSPSLEMFSVQMGLPPRFAGVSLLALGNGAADVSATVSAITSDPIHGYQLSLGALTGAAMFISCVVSSLVILTAGGVPCRGALVRDVTALWITVLVVYQSLARGSVGPETISLFLTLYATFVLLVLAADIYHRAVVLPRLGERAQQIELQRQVEEGRRQRASLRQFGSIVSHDSLSELMTGGVEDAEEEDVTEDEPLQHNSISVNSSAGGVMGSPLPNGGDAGQLSTTPSPGPAQSRRSSNPFTNILAALSNYDNAVNTANTPTNNSRRHNDDGWGIDSDDLVHERPIMLRGPHGVLRTSGSHASPSRSATANDGASAADPNAGGEYTMLEDNTTAPSSNSSVAVSWRDAFRTSKQEIWLHFNTIWEDIVWNGDLHVIDKFLLILEYPFIALRKVTVPIPCEGFYVRAVVALSMVLSPFWLAFYLQGYFVHVLSPAYRLTFFIICFINMIIALLIVRFAPATYMPSVFAVPIALFGFIIAATWIDTIANSLVSVLNFVGIMLGIPSPVLGLTLLAWGNSMSDLSANLTMARKGLANMAMTACFAGPVFNILVGLGLGFSSAAAKSGQAERQVSLSPSVLMGFLFLAVNTACILTAGMLLGKGRIAQYYGYVPIGLYAIYVITSISLQYSNYGDDPDE